MQALRVIWLWSASCAVCLFPVAGIASEAVFVPADIEVCPESADVLDPEFDSAGKRMVFFARPGQLKVAALRDDGTVVSAGCRGTLIDTAATMGMTGYPRLNGPEWGFSQRGTEIFYTRLNADQEPTLARAWLNGIWQTESLAQGNWRGVPFASQDATDAQARIMYVLMTGSASYEFRWRESSDPSSEAALPGKITTSSGGAPRWAAGQRAITMALKDSNAVPQAARYFIDTQTTEFLTTDAGTKDEVWMWPAPEFGGDPVFTSVVNGCCLRVYRRVGDVWTVIRSIRADRLSANKPSIFSPEPFVYRGRSYVAMQISQSKDGPAEIWIVSIDPAKPLQRQVSDPLQPDNYRSEPEWFATAKGAFVYYKQQLPGKSGITLRRAATGL